MFPSHAVRPSPTIEPARLAAVWSCDATSPEARTTLGSITAALVRCYGTRFALASLVDATTAQAVAEVGLGVKSASRRVAFCSHVVADPTSALIVPDAAADPRFQALPLVTGPLRVRAYVGVALVDDDGHALGALGVLHDEPLARDGIPLDALRRASAQASQALQETRSRRAADGPAMARAPQAPEPLTGHSATPRGAKLWLGLKTEGVGPLSWGRGAGRAVLSVAADSPASRAGLRVGDILLDIDGRPIRRRYDIDDALARSRSGDALQVRALRGWTARTFKVQVELAPEGKPDGK